jgi:hypothetical protein
MKGDERPGEKDRTELGSLMHATCRPLELVILIEGFEKQFINSGVG